MTPTKINMTRTQLETTTREKKVGVVYFMAESFFLVPESFYFLAESKILMAESFFFWRRRISQTDSYRDYNDSAATQNVSCRKKNDSARNKWRSHFFWDGNKMFTGGVVRDNLVPPVYIMTPTEEIMTQPKKNVQVQKNMAESLKIGMESF